MIRYYIPTDSNSQNLLAGTFGTQDGHGGRAEQHRSEMEEIACEVYAEKHARLMEEIDEKIRVAQYQAYNQALEDVMRVLEYDIESVTRIGIEGCRDIFEGKKAQQFLSDKVMQMIAKELKNKTFRP